MVKKPKLKKSVKKSTPAKKGTLPKQRSKAEKNSDFLKGYGGGKKLPPAPAKPPLKKKAPAPVGGSELDSVERAVLAVAVLADLLGIHEQDVARYLKRVPTMLEAFSLKLQDITNGVMARAHSYNRQKMQELRERYKSK